MIKTMSNKRSSQNENQNMNQNDNQTPDQNMNERNHLDINPKFYQYYENIWGDRWPNLLKALQISEESILRWNSWIKPSDSFQSVVSSDQQKSSGASTGADQQINLLASGGTNLQVGKKSWPQKSLKGILAPRGCSWKGANFYEPQRSGSENLLEAYIMDPASVLVARALPLSSDNKILDMCAAPGGKSLILAERMSEDSMLVANELSASRRERLLKVIQNYIPYPVRQRVWVKGQDASRWGLKHPESADRVLLDAPCSGERHLLESEEDMKNWSARRGEGLAQRQYALLCSALMTLLPGGYVLYSTCSLNPIENEGVIQKLFKKKEGFKEVHVQCEIPGEPRPFGQIFLPDVLGFGPLYFCLLQKDEI